jgi:hypothetical protein
MPTPSPQQAPVAFTLPVTTTQHLLSSVASSEQLAPSSTVPETSATATESMPASSIGLETQAVTQTATDHTEPTQTPSLARAPLEGQTASSQSTDAGTDDDAAQFEAVPCDSPAPPPPTAF